MSYGKPVVLREGTNTVKPFAEDKMEVVGTCDYVGWDENVYIAHSYTETQPNVNMFWVA